MTLQRDIENLRTAWQDFGYAVAKETRLLKLTARLGMTEKQWVKQARWRAEQNTGTELGE